MDVFGKIFIYALVGLVGGFFLFVKGFTWFRQKQMIENIPTSKIRSLAMGLAEIHGEVVPHKSALLTSPLSGRKCVYYRYAIEDESGSEKSKNWKTVRKGDEGIRFVLKDETGTVLVDPSEAKIGIRLNFTFETGWKKTIPARTMEFMERNGIPRKGLFGMDRKLRFYEAYIAPGDKLYVLATANDNPERSEGVSVRGHEDIMMNKGKNDKWFFISDTAETELVDSLKWNVYGGIGGGIALIAGSLAVIFLYTGLL